MTHSTDPDTTPTSPLPTMTPPPRTSRTPDGDAPLWARVNRWNLAIIAGLIVLCLAWFTWAPEERVAAGADFLVGTLSVLGVIAAVRGHLVAPASTRPTSIPSVPPAPPPPSLPGANHKRRIGSIDPLLEAGLAILAVVGFVLAALFSHGCASTGGVAGAVLAAKPIITTGCMVARRACDLVTRGCDLVAPEDGTSAGGEAPPTSPASPAAPPPSSPDAAAIVPASTSPEELADR